MSNGGNGAPAVPAVANGGYQQLTQALVNQPKYFKYKDYETTDDFPLWLSGYAAKIRLAYGYQIDEEQKVKDEIVRSISGKLSAGSALDAYQNLPVEDKRDYGRLVSKLTEEFADPNARSQFQDNIDFNKRKKKQKLKDFCQEIKRDIDRYSGLTDPDEKERQGVRRFRAGMRTIEGKRSVDLAEHMNYHLQSDDEMKWKHALKVASKWELARGRTEGAAAPNSSSSSSSDDDDVEVVDTKKKKSRKSTKVKGNAIAALADQVHENQMKISKIETAQERLSTTVGAIKESTDTATQSLQAITQKLDASLSLNNNNNNYGYNSYVPPQRSFSQQYYRPPFQQNHSRQPFNAQRGGGFQVRPTHYRFQGNGNQPRQGNYGFQRRTPQAPPAATAPPPANTANSANTATVAAVEQTEVAAETLGADGNADMVTINMADFLSIATQAGIDLNDENMVAAVDQWNF